MKKIVHWNSVEVIAGKNREFNYPSGICYSKRRNIFYITDMHNHRVCMLHENTGHVEAIPNSVHNSSCKALERPLAITCSSDESLYVTDAQHNQIFKKTSDQAEWINVFNGRGSEENGVNNINLPSGITIDEKKNLYVVDFLNNRILISKDFHGPRQFAGGNENGFLDGDLNEARINKPYGLYYRDKKIYFVDTENNTVRFINLETNCIETIYDKTNEYSLLNPIALTLSPSGNIYVAEPRRLFLINRANNEMTLLLDRNIWSELKVRFNLQERLTYIGALIAPEENMLILIDTIKGLVYKMRHEEF